MKSKNGKDMIKVSFDFAKNDKQPGYFEKAFRDDIRPEKKWPNQATQYILTEDAEGNCSRSFKNIYHLRGAFQQDGSTVGRQL